MKDKPKKDKPNSICHCGSPCWICATNSHCTNPNCEWFDPMVEGAPEEAPAKHSGIFLGGDSDLTRPAEQETMATTGTTNQTVVLHFDGNGGHTFRVGDPIQDASIRSLKGKLLTINRKPNAEIEVLIERNGLEEMWLASDLRPSGYVKPKGIEIQVCYREGAYTIAHTFKERDEVMVCNSPDQTGIIVGLDKNKNLVKIQLTGKGDYIEFWSRDLLRPVRGKDVNTVTDGTTNVEGVVHSAHLATGAIHNSKVPTAGSDVDCHALEGDYTVDGKKRHGAKILRIFAQGMWRYVAHLSLYHTLDEATQWMHDERANVCFAYTQEKGWHVPYEEKIRYVRLTDMTVQQRKVPL